MATTIDRRTLLSGALGAVAGVALPLSGFGATGRAPLENLGEGLAVVSGFGGNVLALSTADGLVLVDAGSAEHTDALMARLGDLPGNGRVTTLFNTHWHPEQTGANTRLGQAGARIVAHEKTRLWLATDHYRPDEDRFEPALPPEAHPATTFYTDGSMTAGSQRIDYGYLRQAHTDGDIYVYLRDANVLAVGDVASPQRDPILDWFGGGWLGGRVDALQLLLEISNDNTRIVPAFGPVMTRADLQAEHDVMLEIYERTVERIRRGYSAADMLEDGVMEGLPRTWDDPQRFLYDVQKGLWAHHNRLSPDVV